MISGTHSEYGMIYRNSESVRVGSPSTPTGWQVFVASQQASFTHLVSQPAHAALAGQLAGFLKPEIFGPISHEVINIINRHDRGWFEADLTALEQSAHVVPKSFLAVAPEDAILCWQSSIHSAEKQSSLAGILTSKHFCLLVSQSDSVHRKFVQEETGRRELLEKDYSGAIEHLERYTAALGFCDLLSLFLCCGVEQCATVPLAHPADPKSSSAPHIKVEISGRMATFDPSPFVTPAKVGVHSWFRETAGAAIRSHQFEWTLS